MTAIWEAALEGGRPRTSGAAHPVLEAYIKEHLLMASPSAVGDGMSNSSVASGMGPQSARGSSGDSMTRGMGGVMRRAAGGPDAQRLAAAGRTFLKRVLLTLLLLDRAATSSGDLCLDAPLPLLLLPQAKHKSAADVRRSCSILRVAVFIDGESYGKHGSCCAS